jgi:hypothetical protein
VTNQAVSSGGNISSGGGLYQEEGAGHLTIVNSTFTDNVASVGFRAAGGGLYLGNANTDTLTNVTVARNAAGQSIPGFASPIGSGGGVATGGTGGNPTPPALWNTLIAMNVVGGFQGHSGPDVSGTFITLGHNLIGNSSGSVGFSAARGDLLNVPPALIGLGQLANNGGPTQTLALAANSIAVNHGDDGVLTRLTTDQRGLPRKSGAHVDIGAYEFQVPPPPPPPIRRGRRNGPLF